MGLFGSSGQKKPIDWITMGVVSFILISLAIFIADKGFGVSFIKFNMFLFIIFMAAAIFLIMYLLKRIKYGAPVPFEFWVMMVMVIGGIVVVYWKFPQLAPSFSLMVQSAIGAP